MKTSILKNAKKWLAKATIGILITQVILFSGMGTLYAATIDNTTVTPNQFMPLANETTEISFDISEDTQIEYVKIENLNGDLVYNFVDNQFLTAGNYTYTWYGKENNDPLETVLPDGDYFLRIEARNSDGIMEDFTSSKIIIYSDIEPPEITILGDNPATVEAGSIYSDAGATAYDNVDKDVTASITTVSTVDTSVVDTYTVTYFASDLSGNTASKIRTVNVEDTTPPEIKLLGDDPVYVEVNTAYVDAGVEVTDTYDTDIASKLVVSNPVNINIVGIYTITYDVTDSEGNDAIQVTRTVHVVDTEPPVITLLGSNPMDVLYNTVFTDPFATAEDTEDGDLTANIKVGGDTVNTSVIKTYTITYDVKDYSENPAVQVTRIVNVIDTEAPVITLNGANPTEVEWSTGTYTEEGAEAVDNVDGDLTAIIDVGGDTVDIDTLGTYIISYNVTDSEGNIATEVTRTVNVIDSEAPVITLNGADPTEVEWSTGTYTEEGAEAVDNYDGDLTAGIVIGGDTVDPNTLGTYMVTYTVADSSENTSESTLMVNVVDTVKPVLTLTGSDAIQIDQGTAYTDEGSTASDNHDEDITADIIVTGSVDINTPGVYVIYYNVFDNAGNPADEIIRTVTVVEITPPTPPPSGGGGGGIILPRPVVVDDSDSSDDETPVTLQSEDEEGTVELTGDEEEADEMGMTRAEVLKAVMAIYEIPIVDTVTESPFPDVNVDKWYATYIATAKNYGIVNGYGDGLFRPEREISRAETIKILLEASGLNIVQGLVNFLDTPEYAWYQGYIYYAMSLDMIDGDVDDTFGPDEKITHAEFETLSANLWGAQ